MARVEPGRSRASLPVPHFNVLNGGAHAASKPDFQELMIAPLGAATRGERVAKYDRLLEIAGSHPELGYGR